MHGCNEVSPHPFTFKTEQAQFLLGELGWTLSHLNHLQEVVPYQWYQVKRRYLYGLCSLSLPFSPVSGAVSMRYLAYSEPARSPLKKSSHLCWSLQSAEFSKQFVITFYQVWWGISLLLRCLIKDSNCKYHSKWDLWDKLSDSQVPVFIMSTINTTQIILWSGYITQNDPITPRKVWLTSISLTLQLFPMGRCYLQKSLKEDGVHFK